MAEHIDHWRCEHCGGEMYSQADAIKHEKKCPKNDQALTAFDDRLSSLEEQWQRHIKQVDTMIKNLRKEIRKKWDGT